MTLSPNKEFVTSFSREAPAKRFEKVLKDAIARAKQ